VIGKANPSEVLSPKESVWVFGCCSIWRHHHCYRQDPRDLPCFDDGTYLLAIWMQRKISWPQNGNQIPGPGAPFPPANPGVAVARVPGTYSDPVGRQICLTFPPYEP